MCSAIIFAVFVVAHAPPQIGRLHDHQRRALAHMKTRNTEPTAPDAHQEAELLRLREDNEALRFANLKFGELAERLGQRVRDLERLLGLRQTSQDE
jgi:hypothetical protein